ncbi:MAG: hypothetical protein PHT79_12330 [Syntrophomonadaceae bacterium]|nr:hypothetical protein [Syntrophomonadaceae bacterium]MDD4550531.1 hypothetical protein [Syntrophomonadaceae bacterium]
MNIVLSLLQGILESMGIISCSLALLRIPLLWQRISMLAIVMTTIIYLIKAMPLTYGIHLLVAILCLFFYIIKATNASPSKAFLAVFMSVVILSVLELGIHEVFFTLTSFDLVKFMENDIWWNILGMVQAIILNLIALIISRFFKPVVGKWKI